MNIHAAIPSSAVPPMSAEVRSVLRKAVAGNPGWTGYRLTRLDGLTMDKLSNQQLWDAAIGLGLDPNAIIAAPVPHKPRPFNEESVLKLWRRFNSVMTYFSHKNQQLCGDIFRTIQEKQEDRATVRQYELLDKLISAAEAAKGLTGTPEPVVTPIAPQPAQTPVAPSIEPHEPLIRKPAKTPAEQIAEILEGLNNQPTLDEAAIEAVIDRKVKEALAGVPSITIQLQREPNAIPEPLPGLHHKMFPDLLQVIAARTAAGKPLNIWISGPAASGKTSAAMKVAEALGRPFYGNGAVTFAEQLFGFIDAQGVYHRTAFRNAYENGGVYVFDDTDGSDANATTAFNMGLENGVCPFPDKMVERHPDCVIIATANTWGNGATADYVGRNRLDGTFLDRFGVKMPWDYDVALECAVSGNADWAHRVIAARNRARAAGLKVLITPRASIAGAALIAQGMSQDKAASYTYLANLTVEQRRMVEGEV